MEEDHFIWFSILTIIFLIINTTIYFKSFALKSKAFKIFAFYLAVTCLIQLLSLFVGKVLHKHNLFLSHFYFITQYIILTIFYKELLKKKYPLYVMIPVILFVGFQYIIDPEMFFGYNAIGIALTQVIVILYSIIYFYKSLKGEAIFITVNIGLFLYLISSTLILASGNLILNLNISESLNYVLINVNRVLYFIFQILIFIEWRKNHHKKTLRSS